MMLLAALAASFIKFACVYVKGAQTFSDEGGKARRAMERSEMSTRSRARLQERNVWATTIYRKSYAR